MFEYFLNIFLGGEVISIGKFRKPFRKNVYLVTLGLGPNNGPKLEQKNCLHLPNIADVITNCDNKEACEPEQAPVQLKLLCGGDLLESFAVPGLWADEDVSTVVSCFEKTGHNACA